MQPILMASVKKTWLGFFPSLLKDKDSKNTIRVMVMIVPYWSVSHWEGLLSLHFRFLYFRSTQPLSKVTSSFYGPFCAPKSPNLLHKLAHKTMSIFQMLLQRGRQSRQIEGQKNFLSYWPNIYLKLFEYKIKLERVRKFFSVPW